MMTVDDSITVDEEIAWLEWGLQRLASTPTRARAAQAARTLRRAMAPRGFDEVGEILQMRLEQPLHLFTIAEMEIRQLGGGLKLLFYYSSSLSVDWDDRGRYPSKSIVQLFRTWDSAEAPG